MTSYYCCKDKECLSLSSYDPEKTTDEHGLISNCTKCGNEHVICLFPGCSYAVLSHAAHRRRWPPMRHFIEKHFNVVHKEENNSKRRKIDGNRDHDIQSKSQGVMPMGGRNDEINIIKNNAYHHGEEMLEENNSKRDGSSEWSPGDVDNVVVFDVSEIDACDHVGQEQFHITQATSFVAVVEQMEDETENIDAAGCDEESSHHDEGSVQSDDTSKCWSLINADDLDGITPLDGCIDEEALADDSSDSPCQGAIAEWLDHELIPETSALVLLLWTIAAEVDFIVALLCLLGFG